MKAREILFHTMQHLNKKADVEDVAQEVVIKMYANISKLQSPLAFNAWMYRIIQFVCYTHNRKHKRDAQEGSDEELSRIAEPNVSNLPESAVEDDERNKIIFRAIESLPLKQRESIVMYYYDELSYKEIATAMNVSINTVSTNIMKGKKALKNILENKNGSANGGEMLLGVAAAPAITEALHSGISDIIPDVMVDRFKDTCHAGLAKGIPAGQFAVRNSISRGMFSKVAIAALCVVAVAAGIFVSFNPHDNDTDIAAEITPLPPVEEQVAEELYYPHMEVLGSDDKDAAYENPDVLNAKILDESGRFISGAIYDVTGKAVYNGVGAAAVSGVIDAEVLASLPKGEYEAVWAVESYDKRTADVKWKFVIK
jgi:RNA polymerase sigma-70 factor (ECF subfamily)